MTTLKAFPKCAVFVAQPDWECGPVGRTQCSPALDQANFDAAMEVLAKADPDFIDWETIKWNHYGVGWIEEIFTKPGSEAHKAAVRMRDDLTWYPCLDDDLLKEYQAKEEEELAEMRVREAKAKAEKEDDIIAKLKADTAKLREDREERLEKARSHFKSCMCPSCDVNRSRDKAVRDAAERDKQAKLSKTICEPEMLHEMNIGLGPDIGGESGES